MNVINNSEWTKLFDVEDRYVRTHDIEQEEYIPVLEFMSNNPDCALAMEEYGVAILEKLSESARADFVTEMLSNKNSEVTPDVIRVLGRNIEKITDKFDSHQLFYALKSYSSRANNVENLEYYFENMDALEKEVLAINGNANHITEGCIRAFASRGGNRALEYLRGTIDAFPFESSLNKLCFIEELTKAESGDVLEKIYNNREGIFRGVDKPNQIIDLAIGLINRPETIEAVAQDNSIVLDIIKFGTYVLPDKEHYQQLSEIRHILEKISPNNPKNEKRVYSLFYDDEHEENEKPNGVRNQVKAFHDLIGTDSEPKLPTMIDNFMRNIAIDVDLDDEKPNPQINTGKAKKASGKAKEI